MLISLAVLAGRADGIEETIAGRSLSLRQRRESARLVLVVQAPVVAPLPGGSEDPTLHGGYLEISNPETGEWALLGAPAAGWSMNALGTVFRFRNTARGARPGLRSLVIRHGRRIKVKASTVGITLDERTQGVLAAALATGTRRYCMLFGGEVRRDEPGKFAARNAPAPAGCPEAPAPATTTTTTVARPGRPTTSTVAGTTPSSTSTTTRPTTSSTAPQSSTSTTARVTTSSSTSSTPVTSSSTTTRRSTSSTVPPTTSSTVPPTTSSTARATTTSTSSTTSSTKKPKKDKD